MEGVFCSELPRVVFICLVTGYAFNEVLDCPANLVGRVIGRGGETIKSLQVSNIPVGATGTLGCRPLILQMQNACHTYIDQCISMTTICMSSNVLADAKRVPH